MVTKTPSKPAVKKPRAPKKETIIESAVETPVVAKKVAVPKDSGKYIFATGRRKTSIANVRLFPGSGKHVVNKKPLETYFSFAFYKEKVLEPFNLTGLAKEYFFTAHINGGGIHSQAEALRHGLARALSSTSEEVKNLLKKNGLLTRDDRKKERKKPGLKRARRSPQWAKR